MNRLYDLIDRNYILKTLLEDEYSNFIYLKSGGCCDIYECENIKTKYRYILKCEDESKSKAISLFLEQSFYNKVEKYITDNKIENINIPKYYGSKKINTFRYIIIEKLDYNLTEYINSNKITKYNIYNIAINILKILKFINNVGYIHMDIKPENIMFKNNNIYLIDFGIVSSNKIKVLNKPFKKKIINGTLEFSSINSHNKIKTNQNDLENLGYILLFLINKDIITWINKTNINSVYKDKLKFMTSNFENIGDDNLIKYFQYVKDQHVREINTGYIQDIDYNYLINIFLK